jgi:hypothetical protein
MELPKSGILKRENFNTPLKPIPTTQSSVAKVIILSVGVLKSLSISGSVDFMTQ